MNAVRLIVENPAATIAIPPAMRHRPLEVILVPLECATGRKTRISTPITNPIDEFVGAWCGTPLKRGHQGKKEARVEFQ